MNPSRGEASERRGGRLGSLLLVLLLLASLVSGILVLRARTPDLALEVTELERSVTRGEESGSFTFFVRFDEPDATIEIVGRNKARARTLADGVELVAGRRISCMWDGRDDQGMLVEPGRYRVRVLLPGQGRDMVYPRRIEVVRGRSPGSDRVPEAPAGPCELGGAA